MTSSNKPKKRRAQKKTSDKKSELKQTDTDKAGQEDPILPTLGRTVKLLKKHDFELDKVEKNKRVYRWQKDRPDPSQSHRAEVNRLTKSLATRISSEHRQMFNDCAEKFSSKRAALESAIELLYRELNCD